jgi:hypothetical protein
MDGPDASIDLPDAAADDADVPAEDLTMEQPALDDLLHVHGSGCAVAPSPGATAFTSLCLLLALLLAQRRR